MIEERGLAKTAGAEARISQTSSPAGRTDETIRVGTSGWNYGHWRDVFYPKGLKQSEWLSFYASHFDTVEINNTFYRLPKPDYVKRWELQAPDGFLFSLKGSRYLTHVKRLAETGESVDRFFDVMSALADKGGPVLWQLPPSLKRNEDRLSAFVSVLPGNRRHTFEFRHSSWFCQEVYDVLERAGMALCIPEHPDLPKDMVLTTDWTYLRFHYGRGSEGRFTHRQLEDWTQKIGGFAAEGADVFAYFNNDWRGFAIENALELRQLLNI